VTLVESTQAFVDGLPAAVQQLPEVAIALQLATTLEATSAARGAATLGKELRATLDALRAAAAAVPKRGDKVDRIRERRLKAVD